MPIYISNRKEEKAKWADTRSALTYYKIIFIENYPLHITCYFLLSSVRDTRYDSRDTN